MTNDKQSSSPPTNAQTSGPLPLAFHVHRGRVAVRTGADYSLRQNPKAGTAGFPARVEREKPYPEATNAPRDVEGTLATVTTSADGTPYAVLRSGALRRLTHTDDGLVLRRRMTKAERKAQKRNARGGR